MNKPKRSITDIILDNYTRDEVVGYDMLGDPTTRSDAARVSAPAVQAKALQLKRKKDKRNGF